MRIICPEKEFGRGCDVVVIENSLAQIIQVKSCKLNNEKVNDALKQFEATENLLKEKLFFERTDINDLRVVKIYLHDRRGGCKVIAQSLNRLRLKDVKVINTNCDEGRRLYNLYRRYCPD